jgi:hypothetical protein
MLFKMLVFNRRDGVEENFGALLIGHEDAALQSEAADKLSVIRIDFRDNVGPIGFERVNFRQVAGVNEEQACSGTQENRAKQKKRERHAVNQFPAAKPQRDRRKSQHRKRILAQMKQQRQVDAQNRFQAQWRLIICGCCPRVRLAGFEENENGHGDGESGEEAVAKNGHQCERFGACETSAIDLKAEGVGANDDDKKTQHDQAEECGPNAQTPAK